MPLRPRCPHCHSYLLRRLIPWWEPWLRLVLALTLSGQITDGGSGSGFVVFGPGKLALSGTILLNALLFFVPRTWIFQALSMTMLSNFFHLVCLDRLKPC